MADTNDVVSIELAVNEHTARRIAELAAQLGCDQGDIFAKGLRLLDRIARDIDNGSDVHVVVSDGQSRMVVDARIAAGIPLTVLPAWARGAARAA